MRTLLKSKKVYSLEGAAKKKARMVASEDLGLIQNGALILDDGKIEWIGEQSQLTQSQLDSIEYVEDLGDRAILPGFVECHTHTVFAGNRAQEFEWRNQGISYQEITKKGGGIHSTVRQTRGALESELLKLAQQRADEFLKQGVTTLEVKSGYGLDRESEIKMLRVARAIKGPRVITTFLGAHAKPAEYSTALDYLKYLEQEVLPIVAKQNLADRVDIFIEDGFFGAKESQAYLKTATDLGFDLVVHADQLSLSGGTELAVNLNAKSADHLIQISDREIKMLSESDVTSVLLPAADLYMKCAYPPARKLIDSRARVALATDFNPGSSPTQDLALVGLLARLEMKMSLAEVVVAYTLGAAYALGLEKEVGSLQAGKVADVVVIDGDIDLIFYSSGKMPIFKVFKDGREVSCAS